MGRVIAIDGPSGAGKSYAAKALADKLGFEYLDTGAIYRAFALGLVKSDITPDDSDAAILEALNGIEVRLAGTRVYLNGSDVTEEIRTPDAGHYASVYSAREPLRAHLLPVQQRIADNADLVAEGRDMATVVFPDAWRKIYIDASVEARAGRRYLQLKENGVAVDMEAATRDVVERDQRDSSRDLAPLRIAEDAVYIDTSSLTKDEVLSKLLEVVNG